MHLIKKERWYVTVRHFLAIYEIVLLLEDRVTLTGCLATGSASLLTYIRLFTTL